MRTIQEYLELARENQHLGSDSQLSRKLGLNSGSVHSFRVGKALPSPETMVKLARLAGLDEQVALVELSFMSAPEGSEAQSAYGKILKRISSLLPATLFGLAALHPDTAHAAETIGKTIASLPHHSPYGLAESVSTYANIMYITENDTKSSFNKVSQKQQLTITQKRSVSQQKLCV